MDRRHPHDRGDSAGAPVGSFAWLVRSGLRGGQCCALLLSPALSRFSSRGMTTATPRNPTMASESVSTPHGVRLGGPPPIRARHTSHNRSEEHTYELQSLMRI